MEGMVEYWVFGVSPSPHRALASSLLSTSLLSASPRLSSPSPLRLIARSPHLSSPRPSSPRPRVSPLIPLLRVVALPRAYCRVGAIHFDANPSECPVLLRVCWLVADAVNGADRGGYLLVHPREVARL